MTFSTPILFSRQLMHFKFNLTTETTPWPKPRHFCLSSFFHCSEVSAGKKKDEEQMCKLPIQRVIFEREKRPQNAPKDATATVMLRCNTVIQNTSVHLSVITNPSYTFWLSHFIFCELWRKKEGIVSFAQQQGNGPPPVPQIRKTRYSKEGPRDRKLCPLSVLCSLFYSVIWHGWPGPFLRYFGFLVSSSFRSLPCFHIECSPRQVATQRSDHCSQSTTIGDHLTAKTR